MAKINPIKIKQEADKLEKAGKLEQAIALYRQIVDENPRDWNTINKIGDLYAKQNRLREASAEYAKVADFYAKDGFLLKAIAIWKKINKLDASALEPYLNLADLYAKQGLMMEAKSQYQIVVDEYLKRGKTRDAGEILRRMAEVDPADLKIRSKLADLYTRDGNADKAIEEHIAIAGELNKKGHLAEAVQVLEKGLKIDPRSPRLRIELARIHLVQKSYDKAAHFLEEALRQSPNDPQILARLGEAYLGGKKLEDAEATFKRLLELDPRDHESRAQMGRVYLLQGQFDRAFEEFVPAVDKLLERRESDKAVALLQQVVQKDPTHVKSLVKLSEIFRSLGQDNYTVSTYSQLTEAYIQREQFEQAASVLELLVSMEPQNQQHKTKLQFVRSKQKGRPAAAPTAAPASGGFELEEEEFDLESAPQGQVLQAAPSPPPPAAPRPAAAGIAVAPPAIELSGPLSDEDREFVEEHVAEGKVFRKYGLVDKAADQFEAVVARFPDSVDARQELREIYKEKDLPRKAAEQCLALAEVHRLRGDASGAEAFEAEARRLSPEFVAAPRPAVVAPRPARTPPPPPSAPILQEEEITLAGSEEEEVSLEVEEPTFEAEPPLSVEERSEELSALDLRPETEGEALPEGLLADEAAPGPSGEIEISLDLEEEAPAPEPEPVGFASPAEPGLSLAMEEELSLEQPEPEPPPQRPAPAAPLPPRRPAPAPAPPRHVPAPPPAAVRRSPPAAAARALPTDLERVLDEVDSYVALGFIEDAKDALREVAGRYPGHSAILEKVGALGLDQEILEEPAPAPALEEAVAVEDPLSELALPEPPPLAPRSRSEREQEGAPGFTPGVAAPRSRSEREQEGTPGFTPGVPDDEGIDLGAELGELFGAQSAVEEAPVEALAGTDLGDQGLADIFKEFKKGVDQQLGQEDYDTRYNLGIAYKEMGLVDEAIAEFQLAAKDERRLLECASMLGLCFMEKGMPKLAVKWFEKGLKAPGRSEEEYQGLRYDLAAAHEAAGDMDRALSLYTDLYGQDANFRDVAAKVRELKAAQG